MKNIGSRFNEGKLKWSLVDFAALEEMVQVLEFGAIKYGEWNWQKGLTTIGILNSLLRHAFSYLRGEDIDNESGLSHAAHIACNAMFLLHMYRFRKDMDDRIIINKEKK